MIVKKSMKKCGIQSLVVCVALTAVLVLTIDVLAIAASSSEPRFYQWAASPPMGWNSWDCFGAAVTEQQTMENAEYMEKNLKSHGWNIVTIDIQWYEPLARGSSYRRGAALEMDGNGRLLPAPNRFPSTKESRSFKPIADVLHSKGLKLGVHLMRGIPRQAVDQNVPILGTKVRAGDIADKKSISQEAIRAKTES